MDKKEKLTEIQLKCFMVKQEYTIRDGVPLGSRFMMPKCTETIVERGRCGAIGFGHYLLVGNFILFPILSCY